ncbi:MAG: hypothetical protein WAW35_15820 [Sideroxyarcus sp.]
MARIGLKNRITKLERKRHGKPRVVRVAVEYRVDANGVAVAPAIREWLSTPSPGPLNVPDAFLDAYRGILAPRVMLVPVFDDWEAACLAQQRELLAVCRSRTNEPANTVPVIVGNSFEDDAPAPKRQGTKGRRFVELADGRTLVTETRRYVDEDRKPIAKVGGLSAKWNG